MDDLMGKIGELLSDEESVRQLSELAKMMMSESENSEENVCENKEQQSDRSPFDFDFSSLMKLSGLLGAASEKDKNSELLLALRPHLSPERQEKVDKALKLLKLVTVWKIAKESGIIDEFQL